MATLSNSLQLSKQKPALAGGVQALYTKYRARNSRYAPGDTVEISIPTGQRNQFLLPGESFLEFTMVPTFTATAGAMSIDNSVYSLFRAIRIYHGSSLLVEINHAGRLFNSLMDFNGLFRSSSAITLGCHPDLGFEGIPLVNGTQYKFCVPLPVPLVGTAQSHATPLGFMGAADLRIEIVLQRAEVAFTTARTLATGTYETSSGTVTALAANYEISDIQYSAKLSILSNDLSQALIGSFGSAPISIPATCWSAEQDTNSAASFSMKLNAQYSSLKSILWYARDAASAEGSTTVVANNLTRAHTRFAGGKLSGFWLSLGGESVPSDRNLAVSANGATLAQNLGSTTTGIESDFHPAIPFTSMQRCLNAVGVIEVPIGFKRAMYGYSAASGTAQAPLIGKFLTGFDLERSDGNDSDIVFQGVNTRNSTVDLNLQYQAAPGSAQNIYVFSHYDLTFILDQGALIKAD